MAVKQFWPNNCWMEASEATCWVIYHIIDTFKELLKNAVKYLTKEDFGDCYI